MFEGKDRRMGCGDNSPLSNPDTHNTCQRLSEIQKHAKDKSMRKTVFLEKVFNEIMNVNIWWLLHNLSFRMVSSLLDSHTKPKMSGMLFHFKIAFMIRQT